MALLRFLLDFSAILMASSEGRLRPSFLETHESTEQTSSWVGAATLTARHLKTHVFHGFLSFVKLGKILGYLDLMAGITLEVELVMRMILHVDMYFSIVRL